MSRVRVSMIVALVVGLGGALAQTAAAQTLDRRRPTRVTAAPTAPVAAAPTAAPWQRTPVAQRATMDSILRLVPPQLASRINQPIRDEGFRSFLAEKAASFRVGTAAMPLVIDRNAIVDVGAPSANESRTVALIDMDGSPALRAAVARSIRADARTSVITAFLASDLQPDPVASRLQGQSVHRYTDALFVSVAARDGRRAALWRVQGGRWTRIYDRATPGGAAQASFGDLRSQAGPTTAGAYASVQLGRAITASGTAREAFVRVGPAPTQPTPLEEVPTYAIEVGGTSSRDPRSEVVGIDQGGQTDALSASSGSGSSSSGTSSGGASTDTDGDGIPDDRDRCPNSAPGANVWQYGEFIGCAGSSSSGSQNGYRAYGRSGASHFGCDHYCSMPECVTCCGGMYSAETGALAVTAFACHTLSGLCLFCHAACGIAETAAASASMYEHSNCNGSCTNAYTETGANPHQCSSQ